MIGNTLTAFGLFDWFQSAITELKLVQSGYKWCDRMCNGFTPCDGMDLYYRITDVEILKVMGQDQQLTFSVLVFRIWVQISI